MEASRARFQGTTLIVHAFMGRAQRVCGPAFQAGRDMNSNRRNKQFDAGLEGRPMGLCTCRAIDYVC